MAQMREPLGLVGPNQYLKMFSTMYDDCLRRNYNKVETLRLKKCIFVPTPLEGGGTIYTNEFFVFREFSSIDIFIVGS